MFYFIHFYLYLYAAAAAKSLQSCLTLCDPIDGSPPGSHVPGILQARTLEWVAISFSNAWQWKVKVKLLSHVWLLATPWTAARQAPLPMGFSRREYWSGLPLPSPPLSLDNHLLISTGSFLLALPTLSPATTAFLSSLLQQNSLSQSSLHAIFNSSSPLALELTSIRFLPHDSTETALILVVNDLLTTKSSGKFYFLVFLAFQRRIL